MVYDTLGRFWRDSFFNLLTHQEKQSKKIFATFFEELVYRVDTLHVKPLPTTFHPPTKLVSFRKWSRKCHATANQIATVGEKPFEKFQRERKCKSVFSFFERKKQIDGWVDRVDLSLHQLMLSSSGQGNTKDFLVNVKRRPISFIIIYSVCLFWLVFNKSQGKQVGGHHHFSFFLKWKRRQENKNRNATPVGTHGFF